MDINTTNDVTIDSASADIALTASGELRLNSANYSIQPLFTTSTSFSHTGGAGTLLQITSDGILGITNSGGDMLIDQNDPSFSLSVTGRQIAAFGVTAATGNASFVGGSGVGGTASWTAYDSSIVGTNSLIFESSNTTGLIQIRSSEIEIFSTSATNPVTTIKKICQIYDSVDNRLLVNTNDQTLFDGGKTRLFVKMTDNLDVGARITCNGTTAAENALLALHQSTNTPNVNQNAIEFWCGATPSLRGYIRSQSVSGDIEFVASQNLLFKADPLRYVGVVDSTGTPSHRFYTTQTYMTVTGTASTSFGLYMPAGATNSQVVRNTSLSAHKDNQRPIDELGNGFASELVYDLEPVAFESNLDNNETMFGFVAEQVEQVHPKFASYDADGTLSSVNYTGLVVPIIAEMKKLRAQVQALQAQVDALTP